MPRKFFRKISPSPETFKQSKHLQFLGDTLHLACLWYLNRRTIARAVAIGVFVMWLPTPLHALTVAMLAVLLRANLPIAIITTFINNPITMGPMFYFDYWVGKHVLGGHYQAFKFEASLHWLTHGLLHLWKPLLTGTLILSSVSALIGFYGVHLLWRLHLIRHLQTRRARQCKSRSP
jgi:hypothetical protein